MIRLSSRRRIDVVASSGMLRITVRPKPHVIETVSVCAIFVFSAGILYRDWPQTPIAIRFFFLFVAVSVALSLLYRYSGTEVIEFDMHRLIITKGIRGWERTNEYSVRDCRQLEWSGGGEDEPRGLRCKVGLRTVTFGDHISEDESIEILTALQRSLPDVAQKMCYQGDVKEHFITLGLGR
jgi:hypothetical protein